MLVLAVDTSSASGSLAVLRDDQLLGVICTTGEENYSSRMFRQLDILLGELRLELPAFDVYAVAAGPGSFTGLRVGLAAVKGWAEVHSKPIAAVSALEAVAVQSSAPGRWVAPVLDARRGQIFGALYERGAQGLRRHQEERVEKLSEFLAWLAVVFKDSADGGPAFISPSPALLYFELEKTGFANNPVGQASPVLAPLIGQLGLGRAQRGETVDAVHLDANYVRRTDAELNFKTSEA
ncbi:MAG: tRNA (adenosine(37)-N6)-threonylcarbamoyltransferase complex dimerization subunit type 1 TsaB [Acidobacteria bacterium]|nr:tRNA (adenosine(37)-N6)-threonylcarbamoyltransferase complex dimerization subunit type 1 TsaB [Acidobacteriota bacterium]MCL5286410.1 tRNA (adenosine(37)-N6)-threonylcarbamoyltransferase complex dimerization subunit type 1 TsaB [Acidobacteriota bacterium]